MHWHTLSEAAKRGRWEVKTNRHPCTDGRPWGWIDAKVPTLPGSYWKWTTAEVAVWEGARERDEAERVVREHNEALEALEAPR